jgi:hypothetical protein
MIETNADPLGFQPTVNWEHTMSLPFCDDDAFIQDPPAADGSVVIVVEGSSMCNYYYVHCEWSGAQGQWVCDYIRHEYYEAAHLPHEVEEERYCLPLDVEYASKIAEAFGIPSGGIQPSDVLRTPPARLRELRPDNPGVM